MGILVGSSNHSTTTKYNNFLKLSHWYYWPYKSIKHFADMYATKLSFKRETLMSTLWGDYFLNAKTKRIMKNARENGKKPLFVQLVLDNLWQVYEAIYTRRFILKDFYC